ncbi:MAG: hypothetical protein ACK424_07955, partial [Candidatus Thermochlorobacter sp.]
FHAAVPLACSAVDWSLCNFFQHPWNSTLHVLCLAHSKAKDTLRQRREQEIEVVVSRIVVLNLSTFEVV